MQLPANLTARPTFRSGSQTPAGTAVTLAAGLIACVVFGGLAATWAIPPVLAVAFGLAAVGMAAIMVFRHAFAPISWGGGLPLGDASGCTNGASHREAGGFAVSRIFYYLGAAFIAQLTFRPALSFTLSDWFFLASFLTAGFEVVASHRGIPGSIPRPLLSAVGLFTLGGVLSSFGAISPFGSLAVVLRVDYLILAWLWLGTAVLREPRHIRFALGLWLTSAAATGISAFVQVLFGDVVYGGYIEWGRVSGFTQHVSDLGGLTAIASVTAFSLAAQPAGGVQLRIVVVVAATCTVGGLVLSGAVAGLAAAAFGGVAFLVAHPDRFRALGLIAFGIIGLAFLVSFQQDSGALTPLERFQRVTGDRNDPNSTLFSRVDTNRSAISSIAESPLVGTGLDGASSQTTATGLQVHNIVLGPWFEAGLLGALGIVMALTTLSVVARDATLHSRSAQESDLLLALISGFAAFLVFGMSSPVVFKRYGWVPAALILAVWSQQRAVSSVPNEPAGDAGVGAQGVRPASPRTVRPRSAIFVRSGAKPRASQTRNMKVWRLRCFVVQLRRTEESFDAGVCR